MYVVAVVVAGAGCLAVALTHLNLQRPILFGVLMALAVVTSAAKIDLPLGRSQSNLSLSHAVNFWSLFALGPAPTVCIAIAGAWAQCTLRAAGRNPLHRVVFSIASLTVTVAVAGLPVLLLLDGDLGAAALLRTAAVVAPLYFVVNTALVAGAIALSTRQPAIAAWHRNFLWSAPSYLAGAALAAIATTASERGWFGWLALLAVPLYLVFRSYHTVVARLREEQDQTHRAMEVQLATIEALALAIEAKAGCTPEHIRSIQQYAAMLAEAAGLSDAEVQAVRTAALLHDIGNMAVPEHILAKPDALTPEEFERVKIHPRVGADILRGVPFGAPVSELVLCHHERWDGLGYPAGIRGEEIPLGARILAIADCYSTLQADRPYRPARPEAAAIAVLRDFAGTAFDPALVDLLIARLHGATPASVEPADPEAWPAVEPLALRDIAGTHREEQTLYEIAQALGSSLGVTDAMALIQEKVSRLVPFTTCALFLGDDEQGFVCRYAHGPGTEALFKWAPKSWSDLSLRIPSCADGRGSRGEDLTALLPCPLKFEGRLDRRPGRLSHGGGQLHRRASARARTRHRAGRGRDLQLDPFRADRARVAHRPADRHAEPPLARPSARGRAASRSSTQGRSARSWSSTSIASRKSTTPTGTRSAIARSAPSATCCGQPCGRNDLCARFGGDEFIVVLWDCLPEHEARRVADLQNAVERASVRAASGRAGLALNQRRSGTISRRWHHVRRVAGGRRRADVSRQGGAALAELDQPSGRGAIVTRRNPKTGEPTT